MINRDIVFSFADNKYEHILEDTKDVFFAREYIYNFAFNFTVNHLESPINHIIIYKNGEVYNDYKINQRSSTKYEIKDDNWLGFGNYNYAVELILEGGKIFKNDFYFKIVYSNVEDKIKIRSFSTYGLHENYSYLDIILNLETEYQIDKVLLYNHIAPLTEIDEHSRISEESDYNNHYDTRDIKWSYLGQMEIKDHQYYYTHFSFDTTLKETRTVLYKAVIITTNGITKPIILSTLIYPNSLSLNTISYLHEDTDKEYGIYGGIVGVINNTIDDTSKDIVNPEYDGKVFEMVIDKREKYNGFVEIKIGDYLFHAEKFSTQYLRKKYKKHATNKDPNKFEFIGKGIITKVIDKDRKIIHKDTCSFNILLSCGDDIFTSFVITPQHDNSLALSTSKTGNKIVKYSKNKINIEFDSTYVDNTVDENALDGYFTLNKKNYDLNFIPVGTSLASSTITVPKKVKLPITESQEKYFDCDYITYNDKYFFFVNFDEFGVHIIQYDGINYDKYDFNVRLTQNTINYVKEHDICCFDKKDNLLIKFINFDGRNIFQKVIIENYELTVINCNDMITNIYGELKSKLMSYIQNLPTITKDGVEYELKYNNTTSSYKTKDYYYKDMGYTDYNLKFSAQMFFYKITIPVIVKFQNKTTNVNIKFNANIDVTCREDFLIYDDNISEGNPRYDIDIENINLNYHYIGDGWNLIPQIGYESLNNKYFIKVSKPFKTKNIDDYAIFRNCNIYYGGINLYSAKPQDFYGNDDTREHFVYKDLCRARIYEMDENTYVILNWLKGKLIKTTINIILKKQIGQEIIETDIHFNDIYSYAQQQLTSFSVLLSKSYLYDTIERDMYVFSISDFNKLYYGGYDNVYHEMKNITSISGIPNDNRYGYMAKYSYQYPLNIKNRNTYMNDMVINEKGE